MLSGRIGNVFMLGLGVQGGMVSNEVDWGRAAPVRGRAIVRLLERPLESEFLFVVRGPHPSDVEWAEVVSIAEDPETVERFFPAEVGSTVIIKAAAFALAGVPGGGPAGALLSKADGLVAIEPTDVVAVVG